MSGDCVDCGQEPQSETEGEAVQADEQAFLVNDYDAQPDPEGEAVQDEQETPEGDYDSQPEA
ncbi:hypothetical protein SEA_ENDOR_9 [Microbacterium phage Endor]|nr:hypothetical protein SEA_ENDOR_9 [Microbacterium phage Endor]